MRTLGIERARIVLAPGESQPVFQDAMAEAVEHGLITQEQLDDLTATDIILRGGNRRYVVIEASLEPDQDDLERALRRARVLARATGQDTMPAVAAPELPDGCTSRPTAWESQYLKFQLEQRVASEHLTSPGLGNRRQCGNYAAKTGAPLNPGRRGVPQNTSGNSPPTSKAPGEPR